MLDQSAAFDHDLLIEKVRLYGWDEGALYPRVPSWGHFTIEFLQMISLRQFTKKTGGGESYNMQCRQCEGITVYTDDSTFTITDSDLTILSKELSRQFEVIF